MRSYRSLPLFAVLALLVVSGALLPLHDRFHGNRPDFWNGGVAPLYGFSPVSAPPLTRTDWFDGGFQNRLQTWVGQSLPWRALWTRSIDQILFSLFGISYSNNDTIIVGRDGNLFERAYLDAYCGHGAIPNAASLDRWAATLRRMQDWFAGRGQVFLYVITPSKASFMPGMLPADYRCRPATPAPAYRELTAALARHAVRYVDGHATTVEAAARDGAALPMFVRGGTHWTYLAAAYTVQKLVDLYDAVATGPKFAPFRFVPRPTGGPTGADTDLLELLNLLWARVSQQYAYFDIPAPFGGDHPEVAMVGGSFSFQLLEDLAASGESRKMRLFFYWSYQRVDFAGTTQTASKIAGIGDYAPLLAAPLVILEENEDILASAHGRDLADYIAAQPTGGTIHS